MVGNPRYGVLGMVVLPGTVFFEGLGPLLEISGYFVTTIALATGLLDWFHYGRLVAASIFSGVAATLFALFLSDMATRRYMRGRDLLLLLAAGFVENMGYRQVNAWWGCVGTVQAITGAAGGWGAIKRRPFEGEQAPR